MEEKKLKEYGESEQGNFKVKDSIGIPHPYMITPKHLEFNGDNMYLDIEKAENNSKQAYPNDIFKQAVCDICKHNFRKGSQPKILSYAEHGQALLINCKKDFKGKAKAELKKYLFKIKAKAEKENFKGFSFLKDF